MYGIIYLDFASHKIWKANPPTKTVSNNIISSDNFFLFCIKTIKLEEQIRTNNAF